MKTLKNVFSIFLITFALVTLVSCGDESTDPTPVKTNLDQVKAVLVGKWNFQSIIVTETATSKSATTSSCSKNEFLTAGFSASNTTINSITPEFDLTYISTVKTHFSNKCVVADLDLDVVTTENSDGTVNVALSNGRTFQVNVADITNTTIKANLINSNGYIVRYTFVR